MTAHIEAASPHTMNTYARLPIAMERGQGCRVWDVNGKRYLDGLGGIASMSGAAFPMCTSTPMADQRWRRSRNVARISVMQASGFS